MRREGEQAQRQLPLDFGAELPDLRAPPRPWARRRSPAAAAPRRRLFLALAPDTATRAAIVKCAQDLREAHCLSGAELAAERLHLDLLLLDHGDDEVPDYVVSTARRAVSRLRLPPFELVLDRALSLKGGAPRPFVLGCRGEVAALTTLRGELEAAARDALPWLRRPPFTPHVALCLDDKRVAERPLAEPIPWTVRDFVLVHSVEDEGRHELLGRWLLRG